MSVHVTLYAHKVLLMMYPFLANCQMGMQVNPLMLAQPAAEDDVEEDEGMGVAETYSDYMPSKCMWCCCSLSEGENVLVIQGF